MCNQDDRLPGSVAEALRMANASLDHLNSRAGADLPTAALGEVLTSLGELQAKTSVSSCILLCQFHHDVCIHRWGWQIILHPDGTTEARGPDGQILRSHDPPTLRAG
jgi:hypothetical protein